MSLVSANSRSSSSTSIESALGTEHAAATTKPALSRSLSSLADSNRGNSPDLRRALDLVDLHFGFKVRYIEQNGHKALDKARQEVAQALKDVA